MGAAGRACERSNERTNARTNARTNERNSRGGANHNDCCSEVCWGNSAKFSWSFSFCARHRLSVWRVWTLHMEGRRFVGVEVGSPFGGSSRGENSRNPVTPLAVRTCERRSSVVVVAPRHEASPKKGRRTEVRAKGKRHRRQAVGQNSAFVSRLDCANVSRKTAALLAGKRTLLVERREFSLLLAIGWFLQLRREEAGCMISAASFVERCDGMDAISKKRPKGWLSHHQILVAGGAAIWEDWPCTLNSGSSGREGTVRVPSRPSLFEFGGKTYLLCRVRTVRGGKRDARPKARKERERERGNHGGAFFFFFFSLFAGRKRKKLR